MEIEKIIEDLRAQGLEDEQLVDALKKLAEEGQISEEDLAKAIELLQKPAVAPEDEEKALAEKLLNVQGL